SRPDHPNLFVRNSLICNPFVTRSREISLVLFGQRQRLRSSVAVSRGEVNVTQNAYCTNGHCGTWHGLDRQAMHGGGGGFGGGGGGWQGGGGDGHAGAGQAGGCPAGPFPALPSARPPFFVHPRHFFPHRHFAFFRHRHFFGVGLYAAASCWTWVPTRYGWHRV